MELNMQVVNGFFVSAGWIGGLMVHAVKTYLQQTIQTIKQRQQDNGLMVNKTDLLILQQQNGIIRWEAGVMSLEP